MKSWLLPVNVSARLAPSRDCVQTMPAPSWLGFQVFRFLGATCSMAYQSNLHQHCKVGRATQRVEGLDIVTICIHVLHVRILFKYTLRHRCCTCTCNAHNACEAGCGVGQGSVVWCGAVWSLCAENSHHLLKRCHTCSVQLTCTAPTLAVDAMLLHGQTHLVLRGLRLCFFLKLTEVGHLSGSHVGDLLFSLTLCYHFSLIQSQLN